MPDEWFGIGMVIVEWGILRCIIIWLPFCRMRTNPFSESERILHTSSPGSISLAGNVKLWAQSNIAIASFFNNSGKLKFPYLCPESLSLLYALPPPRLWIRYFISYRQKDNKGDHWVTEFVNTLKTELEATFKEDISIYIDENPHDVFSQKLNWACS